MADLAVDYGRDYAYLDYLEWNDDGRWELFAGEPVMMAAPSLRHQAISMELSRVFGNFLRDKPCKVFAAPVDARLFPKADLSDGTVLQPDLIVVCDKAKLADGRACLGAPDLVVEIKSPSDKKLFEKRHFYRQAGVREYRVIDPVEQTVEVNILQDGNYTKKIYRAGELVPVKVLPLLNIDLNSLFEGE